MRISHRLGPLALALLFLVGCDAPELAAWSHAVIRARRARDAGDTSEVAVNLKAAAKAAELLGDGERQARAWLLLARTQQDAGDSSAARGAAERALVLLRRSGSDEAGDLLRALLLFTKICKDQRDDVAQEAAARELLPRVEGLEKLKVEMLLADALERAHDWEVAAQHYASVAKNLEGREADEPRLHMDVTVARARCAAARGDAREAWQRIKDAVDLLPKLPLASAEERRALSLLEFRIEGLRSVPGRTRMREILRALEASPDTASLATRLEELRAVLKYQAGEVEETRDLLEAAYADAADDTARIRTGTELAQLLTVVGPLTRADAILARIEPLIEEQFGESHPVRMELWEARAEIALQRDRIDEATTLTDHASELLSRRLGTEGAALRMGRLPALLALATGRSTVAATLIRAHLARLKNPGGRTSELARSLEALAEIELQRGSVATAGRAASAAYEYWKRRYREVHPACIPSLALLARVAAAGKRRSAAIAKADQANDLAEAFLDEAHPRRQKMRLLFESIRGRQKPGR